MTILEIIYITNGLYQESQKKIYEIWKCQNGDYYKSPQETKIFTYSEKNLTYLNGYLYRQMKTLKKIIWSSEFLLWMNSRKILNLNK